jgi:hypothetical protein
LKESEYDNEAIVLKNQIKEIEVAQNVFIDKINDLKQKVTFNFDLNLLFSKKLNKLFYKKE